MLKSSFINKFKLDVVAAVAAKAIGIIICRNVSSYIFVANTGRSGSKSLSKFLSFVPNSRSLHEPRPSFFGEILHNYNNELYMDLFLTKFYLKKIPSILWAARGKSTYIETNHSFIKSYSDEAVKCFGKRLKLIWLFRNKNDVALSYYRRHTREGEEKENELMRHWLLDPRAKRNLMRTSAKKCGSGSFWHPIYKYIWYCYESDARILYFSEKYPEIRIVLLPIENLSDEEEISKLCSELELENPVGLNEVIGQKYNASPKKSNWPEDVDKNSLLAFHKICQEELIQLGIGDSELYRRAKIEMARQESIHLGFLGL